MGDLAFGLRLLRTRPGYALLVVLTIALGVAAATTFFSVANGVLLRPLPWADSDGVVQVSETRGGNQGRVPRTLLNGTYLAWASAPQTIESIGAWRDATMTLAGRGDAVRLAVAGVTPSLFHTLRANALRGRVFEPGEGRTGQPPVAILSFGLWEQRFGAREDVIGQAVILDGTPSTIVGVMPREFRFPSGDTRAWVPWEIPEVDGGNGMKRGVILRALARMRPGATPSQAAAEGTARAVAAPDAGPVAMALFGAKEPIQVAAVPAAEAATADVRPAILILLAAAALLFATAVANVANMQVARATTRHRELTIRAALGAGTARLGRQLLIENLIIGVAGAAGGLLLTAGLHAALPALLPAGFPRVDAIAIDRSVLLFTLLLAVVTGVACGVLPLWHVRRLDLAQSLAEGGMAPVGAGPGRLSTIRMLIVASQVAVTCVLLVGAMLLVRSFTALAAADRGYDPANVLTAAIPFPRAYPLERKTQVLESILQRLKGRQGVTHAATSTALPLASAGGFTFFTFPSPLRPGTVIEAESIRRVVTPGYFGALGIRVKAGRPLAESDRASAPGAVVVNRSFVRKYLDDVPIERAVSLSLGPRAVGSSNSGPPAYIVGVVDDVKQDRPDGAPQPEMFVAAAQQAQVDFDQKFIVLRTSGEPADYVDSLRALVREQDPSLAVDGVMTMDQRVGASLSRPRTYAVLLGGFALFALLIAGAGLFGVLSHSVTQRSRELAVRTALGATRRNIVGVVFRQMAATTVAGLVVGLVAASALSTSLAPFIYGVSTRDWVSFTTSAALLLLAGSLACLVPARRIAQADPIQVLRGV